MEFASETQPISTLLSHTVKALTIRAAALSALKRLAVTYTTGYKCTL